VGNSPARRRGLGAMGEESFIESCVHYLHGGYCTILKNRRVFTASRTGKLDSSVGAQYTP
jgi:hypothetical protein